MGALATDSQIKKIGRVTQSNIIDYKEVGMNERCVVLKYLLEQYFNEDISKMVEVTGYSSSAIKEWIAGIVVPNHSTLTFIQSRIFTPEFSVVAEFFEIDSSKPILTQLKEMYEGHEHRSGIYAFYDSMANLLYVGKATNLIDETYSALRRDSEISFPAGIKNKTVMRHQVVKYISAYDVKFFKNFDYPKHVESLILRISKPRMNKQIGTLDKAYPENIEY